MAGQKAKLTGGCQCGAVRFHVEGELGIASICHCRMCQKAVGGFFAPFVSLADAILSWTRGEPQHYQSSNHVRRGFCNNCGTPLTYESPDGIAVSIGAFDTPEAIAPTVQYGTESKLVYVDRLASLPARRTMDITEAAQFLVSMTSYQHPDRDTETWSLHRPTRKA